MREVKSVFLWSGVWAAACPSLGKVHDRENVRWDAWCRQSLPQGGGAIYYLSGKCWAFNFWLRS